MAAIYNKIHSYRRVGLFPAPKQPDAPDADEFLNEIPVLQILFPDRNEPTQILSVLRKQTIDSPTAIYLLSTVACTVRRLERNLKTL